VAAARLAGASPGGRRSLLRAVSRGTRSSRFPDINHAFFNDTWARYDPAAALAYARVLNWFERFVDKG
jgi:dienelactone hydrolase